MSAGGTIPAADGAPALVEVVLASASASRARLLRDAGVLCRIEPAAVDEGEAKRALVAAGAGVAEAATALAELKAQKVSARHPDLLVIGADQILECGGRWLDKPAGLAEAKIQLEVLSGRTHALVAAVVVVRGGARLWHHVDRARLTMRALSESFVRRYLAAAGPAVCQSVGAYQLEGLGAQLFTEVAGDYFTILGLPLLPLLDFLRRQGAVAE